jgi:peptidoglycan/LPS O-acetylase OafA/YrhL
VGVAVERRSGVEAAKPGKGTAADGRPAHHVSGLDGVRGLAVAAVVVYHLGYGWAQGGYLGVDTFLVLSGFLITAGLLAEHERTGRIRLGAFWGRRARRLVPALLLLVAAVAVWAAVAALPDEARSLRLDGLTALGFVSNWRFVLTGQGYFGQSAAPSLLRHTWSLGVEAQLYLLWPPVVIYLLARRGRQATAAAAIALAAASWALGAVLAHPGNVTLAYYGTDTRAAAFLVGAAVAACLAGRAGRPAAAGLPADGNAGGLAADPAGAGPATGRGAPEPGPGAPQPAARPGPPARRRPFVALLGIAGLAVTAYLWTHLSGTSNWLFHGGLALAALSTAAIVAAIVLRPEGVVARAFSVAPLRLLGIVSYGVYLWHWPLFLVITQRRTGLTGPALLSARLAAVAAATALSWFLIERPVLERRAPRLLPRAWHPVLAAGLTVALAAVLLVPVLHSTSRPVTLVASGRTVSPPPVPAATPGPVPAGAGSPAPPPTTAAPPVPVSMAVLGDSVSVTLGDALSAVARYYAVQVTNGGIVGCGVALGTEVRSDGQTSAIPGSCYRWQTTWQATLDQARPDVAVVLLGRWELLDRQVDGVWQHIGEPAYDAYLSQQLDLAIGIAGSDGSAVVVCTAPYFQGLEPPQGGTYPENQSGRVDLWNELVRQAVARHPGVRLFDLNALMSPAGKYADVVDGVAVRSSDGVHFSVASGAVVGPALLPFIRNAALTADTLSRGMHRGLS